MLKKEYKKIILTGGKTGGHVYPALAIIEILQNKFNIIPFYIGSQNGIESKILKKTNIKFYALPLGGLIGETFFNKIKNIIKNIISFICSFFLLLKIKPKVIIGTGGFVCGPVLMAAFFIKIPIILHEQNVKPGITNTILSYISKEIWVTFKESIKFFPKNKKKIITGMPLRESFNKNISKEKAKIFFGFKSKDKVLLIIGGSQGSKIINETIKDLYSVIIKKMKYKIIHITGIDLYDEFLKKINTEDKEVSFFINKKFLIVVPYIENISIALKASDIVITRSGASFISELIFENIFSIQIPLKFSAGNHQFENAKILKNNGNAEIIEEKDLSSKNLKKILFSLQNKNIHSIINNKNYLLFENKTSTIICKEIEKYLGD